MPTYSVLLLAAAGLVAADSLTAMNLGEASGRNVTLAGPGSVAFGVHSTDDGCGLGMTTCDTNCMPLNGICCGLGNGAYCDIGYTCDSDGCCPVGKVCTGPPTGCEGDRDLCGEFCVPKGSCSSGSGGGSGGSGGDGGCPTGYVPCDDECMPAGSVCCHNGYHCDAGQTCEPDFTCQIGGGGGSSGGGGGDSGGDQTTAGGDDGSGPTTSYKLSPNPEPTAAPTQTNPFDGSGGGDDFSTTSEDSQPSSTAASTTSDGSSGNGGSNGGNNGGSDGGSNGGSSGGSNGGSNGGSDGGSSGSSSGGKDDDGDSAGSINTPSLLAGLVAFVPFLL